MKKYKSCIIFILLIFAISCEKENRPKSIRELTVTRYKEILANLDIGCPNDKAESYFTGIIGGKQACYYNGVDGLIARMSKWVTFTTSGPSLNTNTAYNNAANLFRFGIVDYPKITEFQDVLEFWTPQYPLGSDPERFLDSLFDIKVHFLREKEDEYDKFLVNIALNYLHADTSSFMLFNISTHYGSQADSKLVINSVRKFREGEDLYYDLDISLNCTLYHWPQTGKTGEWGKIENGHLHARFKPEFYN